MEFIGIIFYIIVIVIFVNAKKMAKSQGEHGKQGNGNRRVATYDVSGIEKMFSANDSDKKNAPVSNLPVQGKKEIPNVPSIGRTSTPNVPGRGSSTTPNVPRKKKSSSMFMEPHIEEKYQPKIRTNNLWGEDEHAGQRIVALRLMEGDPVPEGYVKIKCPYCGADNLVTKHCKQYHSCYFCRVPID